MRPAGRKRTECIAVSLISAGRLSFKLLLTELLTLAYELNRSELFLFTSFRKIGCCFLARGFGPIAVYASWRC